MSPTQPMRKPSRKLGRILSVGGFLFAIAPILIVLVGSFFTTSNVFDESASGLGVVLWYVFFTFPLGGITCLVGLIIWQTERHRK